MCPSREPGETLALRPQFDLAGEITVTGGCSSGGSTFSVADQIYPALKQFATVDFVKIYDPAGHTERPSGRNDSIPFCLEP